MIKRRSTFPMPSITQLIRWISNDNIKLHIEYFFRFVCVNKIVSVGFQGIFTVVHFLACTAIRAFSALPSVFHSFVTDVSLLIIKGVANGIFTIGSFGAIHTPARK